ncbi:MAG: hypothetical protein ACXVH7_09040, partial [Thermoanaerobaculia bacterium]
MRSFLCAVMLFASAVAEAQSIRPDALRGYMRFLASDALEGRGTATRGHQIAAEYVATQFEALGLKPGASNSYFQTVPFVRTQVDAAQATLRIGDTAFRNEEDFIAYGEATRDVGDVDAPVVFAGYGVTALERKYDDYQGIDVHGKIVALVTGGPSSFPSEERAHYAASVTKMNNAADHGAIGIMTIRSPYSERMS